MPGTSGERKGLAYDIGGILFTLAVSAFMRKHNMEVDERIRELCRRVSTPETTFRLQTLFTSQCKPKGARTYRCLIVAPAGSLGAACGAGSAGLIEQAVQMQLAMQDVAGATIRQR